MSKKFGTSLGEIMGRKAEHAKQHGISFEDIKEILGEHAPQIEFHALGRVRLVKALKTRFGNNYRSVPGISELLRKFDQEAHTELQHHLLKKKLGGHRHG